MISADYIAYAAFWGYNPWNPWDTGMAVLPTEAKCCFCQEKIDSMEMYMVLMELATYAHIPCVEKAVDNDKS
jgi:hypothetical protein